MDDLEQEGGDVNERLVGEITFTDGRLKSIVAFQWIVAVSTIAAASAFMYMCQDEWSKSFSLMLWSTVWFGRMLFQSLNSMVISHLKLHDDRRGIRNRRVPMLYFFHRLSHVFGLCWFFHGMMLLWVEVPPQGKPLQWAVTLWWLQATVYLIPCLVYSLVCLCFPCFFYFFIRTRIPSTDRRPTPEAVRSQLSTKKYGSLLETLRQRYNTSPSGSNGAIGAALSAFDPHLISLDAGEAHRGDAGVNTSCPICFVDFSHSDEVAIMPCDDRHFFHKKCVEMWLDHSQLCPICRANIVEAVGANSATAAC